MTPACKLDRCRSGRVNCPSPDACQLPDITPQISMERVQRYAIGFWRGLRLYRSLPCAFRIARIWAEPK
jgi:hypothetical protein